MVLSLQWLLALALLALSSLTNALNVTDDGGKNHLLSRRRIVNNAEDCQSCSCGLSNSNRIVGGTDADVNKYPWIAMLHLRATFSCGGSLINNKYVLTAGHCAKPSEVYDYEVRFLQSRLYTTVENTITRGVNQVIVHPYYNDHTLDNDIALLKLSKSVPFNDNIRPVCLPTAASSYYGQNGIVIGWGALQENGKVSSELQEVTIPIITNKQCRDTGLRILSSNMCAGLEQGGKDSCQGDSGGPLHVVSRSKFTQAGVVSWGYGCGDPGRPGVYARVSYYMRWIRRNTADACTC